MQWGCSKGVINFPWIFFYAMRSLVPVGRLRTTPGHLFTWLVCGSFQWSHGLLFTDCIVWDDKDKVTGFKRSHWIHLGWRSTGSPKLQPCFNYHGVHTSPTGEWYLLQLTFHEIWHQNTKCSYLKVPVIKSYILSRELCFLKEEIFFRRFVSRSDTPKFRK